jgi:hypothetical protein
MSSANARASSKRVPGSRPATLRNSLSPCTRPSIHLAHTSWPSRLPQFLLWPRWPFFHVGGVFEILARAEVAWRFALPRGRGQTLPATVGSDFWSEIPRPIERNAGAFGL